MKGGLGTDASGRWHRRAWRTFAHSLKLRLVLVFLVLAFATVLVATLAAQKAFTAGWRDAGRPLVRDYIDRLAAEIVPDPAQPPRIDRAEALAARLPVRIDIEGPVVNWHSRSPGLEAGSPAPAWARRDARHPLADWSLRTTADGHRLRFGVQGPEPEGRPAVILGALAVLLLLPALAYRAVRRLFRPIETIGAGVRRFGAGDFSQPIAVRHPRHPDELGELALTINTMGRDIHAMLEAQRTLLLAISHELRSPLTRARLHTELLPEDEAVRPQREALQREIQAMSRLIGDLLESERLAGPNVVLQREAVDPLALVREVVDEVTGRVADSEASKPADAVPHRPPLIRVEAEPGLGTWSLDPARVRLLVRNLLDNALRHGAAGAGASAPEIHLKLKRVGAQGESLEISVRDHGPGVPPEALERLAEPFWRPDAARTRQEGGVGLGLTLCRRVAEAHGGRLLFERAAPGLRVRAVLPALGTSSR